MDDNNEIIINTEAAEEEIKDSAELTTKTITDNNFDSLEAKQKLWEHKVKHSLRIATFVVACIVLVWLLCILNYKLSYSFSEVLDIYLNKDSSDVLWFYGISIFSLMLTILTITMALINIFAFKKKNKQEENTSTLESLKQVAKILKDINK